MPPAAEEPVAEPTRTSLACVDDVPRIVVSRRIDAPAARVFALLADPARHARIDGSGTVRSAVTPGPVGAVGDRFRMRMYREDRGGEYETDNVVTTFEPGHAIGWATTYPDQEPLGYSYTFLLTPVGDDRTVVTEVYDWSGVTDPDLLRLFPRVGAEELDATLDELGHALE